MIRACRLASTLCLASFVIVFLLGGGGCRATAEVVVRQGPPSDLGGQRIAVAPVVFLEAFVEPRVDAPDEEAAKGETRALSPIDDEAFVEGVYVGHLHLAGGYVVVETERGMQYRSKTIAFSEQERYRKLAREWVGRSIKEILTWRRVAFIKTTAISPEKIPAPERREVRGSRRLDLRDNQNLPRFDLEPAALDEKQLAQLPDLQGAPLLLVPFVANYYSHNGGWFVGQTYGTGAGARIRLLWAIYDTSSGRVVRWGEIQGRHVEKYIFSPNSTQIDDYLLMVEEAVTKELRRRLLR